MRPRSRGFTLIEIAVAMAVLGVGVVTLQQIYQGALRLQDRASRHDRAVLHARAKMDSLLVARYLEETEEGPETTQEGFRTRALVRRATPADFGVPSFGGVDEEEDESDLGLQDEQVLLYVEVEVAWSDGVGNKTYTLKSVRTSTAEEQE
jgi:prepilin-type N-terminal cleavage/methylation domain-containing protein